jgi:hypothetical protein
MGSRALFKLEYRADTPGLNLPPDPGRAPAKETDHAA